jgi:hypothetical protein
MKKLIIVAVLLIVTSVQMFAGITIGVKIEFGHKNEVQECIERGFCRIDFSFGRSMVNINVNDNTGNLEMTVNKSAFSGDVLNYQFANGVFEVPVAYSLSADLCSKLGVQSFTIKSGKYKVVETKESYFLVFIK